MLCPRDETVLISPAESGKSVFSRNGIFHCPTCAGLAINSDAASSKMCSEKLLQSIPVPVFKCRGISLGSSATPRMLTHFTF